MARLTYTILLCLLNFTLGQDCVINNVPEYMTWKKELIKELKCGYNKREPPSANLTIDFKFIVKSFNFYSNEGLFTVQHWMFVSWEDKRLQWDPAKHHDINEMKVSIYGLWAPNFELSNSADSHDFYAMLDMRCYLNHTGYLQCVSWMVQKASCDVKLTHWPYDVQECHLELQVLNSLHTHYYTMVPRSISITGAEYSSEWYITDYKHMMENSRTKMKVSFTLQREAAGLAAIIIYPSLILTVLSITALFLDYKSYIRLGMVCFSMYGHYYFLLQLGDNMPLKNTYPPTILLYYRGSMVLTAFIILLTFFLNAVCKLKLKAQYVQPCNNFVYESYGKYFVFPLWNFDDSKYGEDWTKFANFLNSAFIFIIVIAYVSLYGSMMPKSVPLK